ncbi:hypothetical protein LOD99_1360 [Oopsacas minuta]|uniref:RING-type domain-containing protein n=1 Tax=Oopsacas minuta TaxID=111878 RepID=A0AAV7K6H2_9METZ|nr:hypothetical protein LOD99_1360 [Oopsacas minuta]
MSNSNYDFFDSKDSANYQFHVPLRELNPYITCSLCAGYLIDATTIMECHHRFCKSCIVRHLQASSSCPECNALLNDSDPLSCLAFDRDIQDLVYKLVPGLQESEKKMRTDFYISRSLEIPNFNIWEKNPSTFTDPSEVHFHSRDEKISLEILPHHTLSNYREANLQTLSDKYTRCSMRTLVYHLKRFIHCRIKVPHAYELELLCKDNILRKDTSLKEVYLQYWATTEKLFPVIVHYTLKTRLS